MIYSVDYLLKNKEAFEAEKRPLPALIVCDGFEAALKAAKKFESDNVTLFEVKPHVTHDAIIVARGYKGLATEKETA